MFPTSPTTEVREACLIDMKGHDADSFSKLMTGKVQDACNRSRQATIGEGLAQFGLDLETFKQQDDPLVTISTGQIVNRHEDEDSATLTIGSIEFVYFRGRCIAGFGPVVIQVPKSGGLVQSTLPMLNPGQAPTWAEVIGKFPEHAGLRVQ
jgi:hypothetical protein